MKEIQQSTNGTADRDWATVPREGQCSFTAVAQARCAGGLKVRHKAGIALLQKTGQRIEVLLVRQANGLWSLPKGKRKKGESIKQTGLRECLEETGHEAQALSFVGWGVNSRKHTRFYLWKSEMHRPSSEHSRDPRLRRREILGIAWVGLAQAQQLLKPWQASLLAKIMRPATTTAV